MKVLEILTRKVGASKNKNKLNKTNKPLNPKAKLSQVKCDLFSERPFFGRLLSKLKFIEDPSCKTVWTDGVRLGYNPDFIGELSFNEIKSVFYQEILHCVLLHPFRKENYNHEKWNNACNFVVNLVLKESWFVLPSGALLDRKFTKMNADKVYAVLSKQNNNNNSEKNVGSNRCGEVRLLRKKNGKPFSSFTLSLMRKKWKMELYQSIWNSVNASEVAGKLQLPIKLITLILEKLEPTVNWKRVLQKFVHQLVKDNYKNYLPKTNLGNIFQAFKCYLNSPTENSYLNEEEEEHCEPPTTEVAGF